VKAKGNRINWKEGRRQAPFYGGHTFAEVRTQSRPLQPKNDELTNYLSSAPFIENTINHHCFPIGRFQLGPIWRARAVIP
jgi:hypothetical protein